MARKWAVVMAAALAASPAAAVDPLSEVSGNWAGPEGGGFYFSATLEQAGDAARLRIWHAPEAAPQGGDPALDVADFALSAFVTEGGQWLEVVDLGGGAGSILQVITEFADEEAEGREVVQLQYLDNQFTVTGFFHRSVFYNPGGATEPFECEVDVRNGIATVDGQRQALPPMDFEAMNAAGWSYGAAFERGWCPRVDGG